MAHNAVIISQLMRLFKGATFRVNAADPIVFVNARLFLCDQSFGAIQAYCVQLHGCDSHVI